MRLLSILPFSPPAADPGGAELQMHSLHAGLRRRGVEVHVLADAAQVGEGVRQVDGVCVWGVAMPALTSSPFRPGNVRAWLQAARMPRFARARVGRVDLVQATPLRQPALWAHAIARDQRVPWVARMAGSGAAGDLAFMRAHWLTRRALPRVLASAAAVVAVDEATAEEACSAGVDDDRLVRIASGLTVSGVPDPEEAARLRPGGPILFVGRLAPEKRVATLVRAYARLPREDAADLPRLEIVGGGNLAAVEEEAGALLATGAVVLHGRRRPEPFLSAARCFVNPSHSEGMPNSVLEACAFGAPPILSDIPVHRRIAAATGMEDFLFPAGDDEALAAAIRRFVQLDPAREAALRARAAAYGQGFTAEARDAAYVALYERVLASRPAGGG